MADLFKIMETERFAVAVEMALVHNRNLCPLDVAEAVQHADNEWRLTNEEEEILIRYSGKQIMSSTIGQYPALDGIIDNWLDAVCDEFEEITRCSD